MSPLVQRSRSSTARTTPYGAGQLIQFQCDAPDPFSFTTSQPSISPPSPGTFEVINLNSPDSEPSSPESNYSAESPPSIPADDTSSLADGEGGQRTTSSRGRPADHIRRPRNAFMIFRSDFWAKQKINKGVETDHRHISRIIGHCWNELPEDEKLKWRVKADLEKLDHEKRYPNYRFTPTPRAQNLSSARYSATARRTCCGVAMLPSFCSPGSKAMNWKRQ
ncbi:high mobility group box domain-containing protein [Mycena rebaudengoi]|nr:high mobility group box domain-containing protein [Mycena rebaudengoi]